MTTPMLGECVRYTMQNGFVRPALVAAVYRKPEDAADLVVLLTAYDGAHGGTASVIAVERTDEPARGKWHWPGSTNAEVAFVPEPEPEPVISAAVEMPHGTTEIPNLDTDREPAVATTSSTAASTTSSSNPQDSEPPTAVVGAE